nr:uncharacterized protein LOC109974090 isoform X2 [Monopterus albus]XP_020479760.1 uncharacterized protein LOC109974090 isoform X2 [Monopterus albus]
MAPQRSSRISKKSHQRSPRPAEEVTQRLTGKREKMRLRETKAGGSRVNTHKGRNCDILDMIDSTHEAECVTKEDEGKCVEVTDKGLDEPTEDSDSVNSSTASGPSFSYHAKDLRLTQQLCSACQKLYQKSRKMKKPIKSKLLDIDPKSMTCDQWVLIKQWRPRRLINSRGKLLLHVQLVMNKRKVRKHAKQSEQSACSRPHIFLKRNLRRCTRVPVKQKSTKNKRGRRTQGDSQCPRTARQQHLNSKHYRQRNTSRSDDSGHHSGRAHSSRASTERSSDQEVDSEAGTDLTVAQIPSTVILETTMPRELPPTKRTPRTGRFKRLLTQLRNNSSMVVRETR